MLNYYFYTNIFLGYGFTMRYDHTNWLIHFVRDRCFYDELPDDIAEKFSDYVGGEIEFNAPSFSVLKTIIQLGGLIPGYSFRSGKTTIFGGKPVLCATEMPIYSFARYVRDRNESKMASAYGVAFLKKDFFSAGGRPVIYGLTTTDVKYIENSSTKRIINPSILPLKEQYRYVSYNPSGNPWIDWSHEREWRWSNDNCNSNIRSICSKNDRGYIEPVKGLPLFAGSDDNGFFSSIGIIVWDEVEAKRIQEILTGFFIYGANNYGTPFDRDVIENSFIIILNKVINSVETGKILESQTIEGLTNEKITEPIIIHTNSPCLENSIINAIQKAKDTGLQASKEFLKKNINHKDICGFVNIVSNKITEQTVQQLIKMKVATGPYDGKVIIHINGNWESSQNLSYHEYIFKKMCNVLNHELQDIFYTESLLD